MMEPAFAYRTALRAALISDERLASLVEPQHVRAGQGPPEASPSLLLGEPRAHIPAVAADGRRGARVAVPLHIWTRHDWGAGRSVQTAKAIGSLLLRILAKPPELPPGLEVVAYHASGLAWANNPATDLAWMHGVIEIETVLRWAD